MADFRGQLNQRRISRAIMALLLAGMVSDAWLCCGVSGTTMFDWGGRQGSGGAISRN